MTAARQITLTGITTTGVPHLGNLIGAIQPAINAAKTGDEGASFLFLADMHALTKLRDPQQLRQSVIAVAAAWMAAGIDLHQTAMYRQTDVPEIVELMWVLQAVCAKGLLNRAHAYKAAVDANTASGRDPDAGIDAALYCYPVLMAADILAFRATAVPVGADQAQHLEMCRDMAARFNHLYGECFPLPEAIVRSGQGTLVGPDGRKMSKSYGNIIGLGATDKQIKKAIASIVTDSLDKHAPKDPDTSVVYKMHAVLLSREDALQLAAEYREGMPWGEAKKRLTEALIALLAPVRDAYNDYLSRPKQIEEALAQGSVKAREVAGETLREVRALVGWTAARS